MIEPLRQGLFKECGEPAYGNQDVGITPGGAMDLFSMRCGLALLGDSQWRARAWEIIITPALRFTVDSYFVLTGARHEGVALKKPGDAAPPTAVEHGVVTCAPAGSELSFGTRQYGFRTYLCVLPAADADPAIEGRERGTFDKLASWIDPDNKIRVMKGPEYRFLDNPGRFPDTPWKTTHDLSDMGMRLAPLIGDKLPRVTMGSMISGAVSNGTVQLTPKGPIILLRYRQTVGGYPRIFNVISADVDLLGQYGPDQVVRFKTVSLEEARGIAKRKKRDLEILQNRYR